MERLEVQRRKLADRLAGVDAAAVAAQDARRRALVEGDPEPAEAARLDRACAVAIEARAGVEGAARSVATQLEDAIRARDALVDGEARKVVITDCEQRAAAIDAAAEALAGAADAFARAATAMGQTITEHGLARPDGLSPHYSGVVLARPIIAAALRRANPDAAVLPPVYGLSGPATVVPADPDHFAADPIVTARRVQSGLLRDIADDVKAGRAPPVAPPVPGAAKPVERIVIPETSVVLKHGVAYVGPESRPTLVSAGQGLIPAPVAEAAIKAGMAARAGTPAAADILRELEASAARSSIGLKSTKEARAAHVALDFDLGTWLDAERVRRRQAQA